VLRARAESAAECGCRRGRAGKCRAEIHRARPRRRGGCRPFQIGGVLNGQNVIVKRGSVGALLHGCVLRAADGFDPVLFGGAKTVADGLNGCGLGICPAFELQNGQVRHAVAGKTFAVATGDSGQQRNFYGERMRLALAA